MFCFSFHCGEGCSLTLCFYSFVRSSDDIYGAWLAGQEDPTTLLNLTGKEDFNQEPVDHTRSNWVNGRESSSSPSGSSSSVASESSTVLQHPIAQGHYQTEENPSVYRPEYYNQFLHPSDSSMQQYPQSSFQHPQQQLRHVWHQQSKQYPQDQPPPHPHPSHSSLSPHPSSYNYPLNPSSATPSNTNHTPMVASSMPVSGSSSGFSSSSYVPTSMPDPQTFHRLLGSYPSDSMNPFGASSGLRGIPSIPGLSSSVPISQTRRTSNGSLEWGMGLMGKYPGMMPPWETSGQTGKPREEEAGHQSVVVKSGKSQVKLGKRRLNEEESCTVNKKSTVQSANEVEGKSESGSSHPTPTTAASSATENGGPVLKKASLACHFCRGRKLR